MHKFPPVPSCSNFGVRLKTSCNPVYCNPDHSQTKTVPPYKVMHDTTFLENPLKQKRQFTGHKMYNFAHKTNDFELFITQTGAWTRFQDVSSFFFYKRHSKSRGSYALS